MSTRKALPLPGSSHKSLSVCISCLGKVISGPGRGHHATQSEEGELELRLPLRVKLISVKLFWPLHDALEMTPAQDLGF
jgi:hypothetical protein